MHVLTFWFSYPIIYILYTCNGTYFVSTHICVFLYISLVFWTYSMYSILYVHHHSIRNTRLANADTNRAQADLNLDTFRYKREHADQYRYWLGWVKIRTWIHEDTNRDICRNCLGYVEIWTGIHADTNRICADTSDKIYISECLH